MSRNQGVEVHALGDIARLIRGNGMPKTMLTSVGIGAIHYGQIYTRYGTWTSSTYSFVTREDAARLAWADPGDVIITNTSENLDDVGKAVAWLGTSSIVTGGHATIIKHSMDPKYLAYWFQSPAFREQKKKLATGTKVIDVSARQLEKVLVPVPSIEVQREIVGILDTFTELEEELEAQLEAELETRRRQYNHYRSGLLTPSKHTEWNVFRLDEIVDVLVGFPFQSTRFTATERDTALIRGDNISQGALKNNNPKRWHRTANDNLERYELEIGDIVLAMDRPWIPAGLKWARISTVDLPALLVQRVARLRVSSELLDQGFLGCVISSARFTEHVLWNQTGNTVPHISSSTIGSFRLALPPLDEQRRIAEVSEQLEALTNGLSVGLPTELAARRQQFEYYRDKLLTFEELTP